MSAGGVFKLIANDGKADRMIMATDLLNERIKDIMCRRAAAGKDPTPTLVDIERTHILFVNAHFKPFAAIGYEYNKVPINSGTARFNNNVQFSIPQFGDFFYDMVLRIVLDSVSCSAGTVPALPARIGADAAVGADGDALYSSTDLVSGSVAGGDATWARYKQRYHDLQGNTVAAGAAATNFVRYCEFPGQRLCQLVKFDVNGNPLDEYNSEAYMFHQKFCVTPNKQVGWSRLVGQEVPVKATSDLCNVAGASALPDGAFDLREQADANNDLVLCAPRSAVDTSRKVLEIVNGPQTPKATQPSLEMFVPLLFWFNKDARLSIPSVSIPYGQRFISVTFAPQADVVFKAPGSLFCETTTDLITNDLGTAAGDAATAHVKVVSREPVLALNSEPSTAQEINTVELYINNIFVNPAVHDIYIKRIGFSLIRVYRYQSNRLTSATNQLLSNLKWPIETLYVGLRPSFNTDAANPNKWRDWHRLNRVDDVVCSEACPSVNLSQTDGAGAAIDYTLTGAQALLDDIETVNVTTIEACERLTYTRDIKTVDSLSIEAHGISIFNNFPQTFFNAYMPYAYGGHNIVTPSDEGALMINFCLYPGTYQPSGHINVSRAREFYINVASSYLGADEATTVGEYNKQLDSAGNLVNRVATSATADLLVLAICINFLLISDGSAVLRYST